MLQFLGFWFVQLIRLFFIFVSFLLSFENSESAITMDDGESSIGIFQPYRRAFKNNVEMSTYPIYLFVMPNFKIKKEFEKFNLSGQYGVSYPTPLLRILQKKGLLGIIPPEEDIGSIVPHLVGLSAEIITSRSYKSIDYTLKGGIALGLSFGSLDDRMIIELPIIYPRYVKYFSSVTYNLGFDSRFNISNSLSFLSDIDVIFIGSNQFLENKFLFDIQLNKSIGICLGSKLAYGEYSYGKKWRLLPLFDLIYNW